MADTYMETDLLSYISPGQVGVALKKNGPTNPRSRKNTAGHHVVKTCRGMRPPILRRSV